MAVPLVYFAVHVLSWGDPPSSRRILQLWGTIFHVVADVRAFDDIVTGALFAGLVEGLVTGQKWALVGSVPVLQTRDRARVHVLPCVCVHGAGERVGAHRTCERHILDVRTPNVLLCVAWRGGGGNLCPERDTCPPQVHTLLRRQACVECSAHGGGTWPERARRHGCRTRVWAARRRTGGRRWRLAVCSSPCQAVTTKRCRCWRHSSAPQEAKKRGSTRSSRSCQVRSVGVGRGFGRACHVPPCAEYAAVFAQTRGTDAPAGSVFAASAAARAIRDLPEALQRERRRVAVSGDAEPIDSAALFGDDGDSADLEGL